MLVGLHVATNFQIYRQNSEKALWGGGGGVAPLPPPPPPHRRLRYNGWQCQGKCQGNARGKFKDLVCLVVFIVELNAFYYFHCV